MDDVEKQLVNSKVIAVVGLSAKSDRDSYRVAEYLKKQGYRIIPVNPSVSEVLEEKSYPDLKSISGNVDMVNIFRRSEDVPSVVDEALAIGVKYIWMQEGIINVPSANKAQEAGISVVMDRCTMKEHSRMYGALSPWERPPYTAL